MDTTQDLDPNMVIGADDETLPYAEEDWQDPEQIEVPKNLEPDLPFTIQTRQKDGTRPRKKYNPYGDDFAVDRIDLKKKVEEVVGLEEITVSQDIDIVDDHETRLPTATDRVTIPDPSDTLGDPVVEQTVRKLIETAGRLVANKNAPGSGVTAPYGTIDDTGRVRLSLTVIRQGISDVTPLMGSSKTPERRIQKMPAKKVSRVIDIQKNNQLRFNFTGVPETDLRACFNRAT